MKLVLPYPPSSNRYWRVFKGIVVKSKEARAYQESIKDLARAQIDPRVRFPVFKGVVSVSVVVFRPRAAGDLDNTLKVMLDALKGIAFADDDQVVRIVADRGDDKMHPRAEIHIQPRILAGQQTALELAEEEAREHPPAPPVVDLHKWKAGAVSATKSFRSPTAVPTEE